LAASSAIHFQSALSLIADDMREVDRSLRNRLDFGVPLVGEVSGTSFPQVASGCVRHCCC
jgi:hypothetical protein